jgi:hypothetical protein
MKRILRIIILIVVLFGILGLARNQIAWAAHSPENAGGTAVQTIGGSVSPEKGDNCDEPWNKNKDRCKDKDKDKDKDKCKKHREDCGSVKPPPHEVVIPVTGEYSVGGFCTISLTLNDPNINLNASIKSPLPRELPDKVQKVRQGCLLTYYSSNHRLDELPSASGNATICFAASPNKQMTVYFYNLYAANPGWVALETKVEAGKACAQGNASGVYVATFQKP